MADGPVGSSRSVGGELAGCRVLVTRERPGELARLLTRRGAEVVHVPLIAVAEPADGGAALRRELARLDRYGWIVVTSAAGAERVGAAVAARPDLRTAAVGTVTAQRLQVLSGREVDVVPQRQLAAALADELIERCPQAESILVAQADRADDGLARRLAEAGHEVTVVTAYATVLVEPDADVVAAVADVDVLVLASGSAAIGWVDAFGVRRPPLVVAIGPSTAEKAEQVGLKVDGVAAEHSLEGLVDEVVRQVMRRQADDRG